MHGEYNDSHMLCKSLERIAAQALHLKDKIEAGLQLPSWAEYKVYLASSGINKALGTAYPGMYEDEHMKMSAAAITPAYDNSPALKGKQSRLPDKVQLAIIKKRMQRRPSRPSARERFIASRTVKKAEASVEKQIITAMKAEGGAAGMPAIRKRVKSPELLSALRKLMAEKVIYKHRSGDLILK
jgi:hypothetical protein